MELKDFLGKTVAECNGLIKTATRGLHPNVNNYLYLSFKDKDGVEHNVFVTKAASKNFSQGQKPWKELKFVETKSPTLGITIIKLGMGKLNYEEVLDSL
jgi:hypothetical protein